MTDSIESIPRLYRRLARLPLRLRRRVVRAVYRLGALRRRVLGRRGPAPGQAPGQAPEDGYVRVFRQVLRLPGREARRLGGEARIHDLAAEVEWLALHDRSLRGIRADMRRIRVEAPEILRRAAATQRPVILAPLHMGAYVAGLGHTMLEYFPGRPLLILRQREDLAMETVVMERIRDLGVEMRFLNVANRADFLAAVRFGKAGAVMVVFCDLPPSYGAATAMPMFGLPLRFAFGHDTLARLTNAVIVPWATRMELDGDRISVGEPFDLATGSAADRDRAARLMSTHIRGTVSRNPEQWHFWPRLDEYLPASATSEATPRPRAA